MTRESNSEKIDEKEILRQNIILDIYLYEKELLNSNLKNEDKQCIKEKIEEAENLFKCI